MSADLDHPPRADTEIVEVGAVGRDQLVLLGSFNGLTHPDDVVVLDTSGDAHTVPARWWHDPSGGWSMVVVTTDGSSPEALVVGDVILPLPPPTYGLRAVLTRSATAAPAAVRADILGFLLSALGRTDAMSSAVSEELHRAREALREHRPAAVVDRALPPGMQVELALSAGAAGVYLRGWIGEPDLALRRLVAISPEGERIELLGEAFRFPKADVAAFYGLTDAGSDQLGFAALVPCTWGTVRTEGWLVEVETLDGRCFEGDCPPVVVEPRRVRELLMYELTLETAPSTALRARHVAPALAALGEAHRRQARIVDVVQYGVPPSAPDVSVVVPLYRRIDFVEHQLAQFVHDPYMAVNDIIYVLDSPELADQLLAQAKRLHRLYRVPFRVVVLSDNTGFSTANNLGVSVARGRLLLLMNSDVLPLRPGWLRQLVAFHDDTPGAGCVGPKLLYEDDSIQHAGMYFERSAGDTNWVNEHHYKGMHRSFAPACVDRRVAAVTGACLLVEAERYRLVGGLLGSFVQGDYEDSDLCLRLHEEGFEHWYVASVELYHLEGQSYPSPLRALNHEFNSWLHTSLWDEVIASLPTTSEVH